MTSILHILTILIFGLIFLEVFARIYTVIKLRDAYYFVYGEEQVRRLWKSFFNKRNRNKYSSYAVIATFGGSTTNWGGMSQKYNYSQTLERMYRIKVANCGEDGIDSFGELESLKKKILSIQRMPTIAFFYSGLNDAINARHYEKNISEDQLDEYLLKKELQVNLLTRFKGAVKQSSIAYRLIKDKYSKKNKIKLNTFDREKFIKSRVERFKQNALQMISICKEAGIHIYFGTVPLAEEYKKDHPGLINILKQLYLELFKVCEEHGVPIIDIDFEIYKLSKVYRDRLFTRDGIHMNKKGNEFIAKCIYEGIKANGLL